MADEIAARHAAVVAGRVDEEQAIARTDGELRHDREIDADDAVRGEIGVVVAEAAGEARARDARHLLADMREADARAEIGRQAMPIAHAERRPDRIEEAVESIEMALQPDAARRGTHAAHRYRAAQRMEIEAGIFEIAFDRDERIDVIAEREAGGRAGLEIEIAVEGDGRAARGFAALEADALRHDHAGIDADIEPMRQGHGLSLGSKRRDTDQQRRDRGTLKQTTHFLGFLHRKRYAAFLGRSGCSRYSLPYSGDRIS